MRQLHNLVTDFIVQMPLKVKELRNRGDETARIIIANQQEMLEPPAGLRRDFENMMKMVKLIRYILRPLYIKCTAIAIPSFNTYTYTEFSSLSWLTCMAKIHLV